MTFILNMSSAFLSYSKLFNSYEVICRESILPLMLLALCKINCSLWTIIQKPCLHYQSKTNYGENVLLSEIWKMYITVLIVINVNTYLCQSECKKDQNRQTLCFNHIVNVLNLLPVTTVNKSMGEHWPKIKQRKNPPCILNVWGYTAGKAVANATDDMKYFSLNFKCTVFTVIHPVQHWAVWINRNQMREAQAGGRNKKGLSILIQLLFK